MQLKHTYISLMLLMLFSLPATLNAAPGDLVNMPDAQLRQAIIDTLALGGDPTEADMALLTTITIDGGSYLVSDLTGIEYAVNLTELLFTNQLLSDFSPLASLTLMENLDFTDCSNLSDISFISTMVNLVELIASNCIIEDISPLSNLTLVSNLRLDNNLVKDISPLVSYVNTGVDLTYNQIEDLSPFRYVVPIGGFNIDVLDNPLNVGSTCIIAPEIQISLTYDDFFLFTCSDFVYIADSNLEQAIEATLGVPDPTPADFELLTTLNASSLGITDLSGLEAAVNLVTLNLSNNAFTSLAPIQYLGELTSLDVTLNTLDAPSNCEMIPLLKERNSALIQGVTLLADVNPLIGDCTTDPTDLIQFSGAWLNQSCTLVGNSWCNGADIDENGKVDLLDFVLLSDIWMN